MAVRVSNGAAENFGTFAAETAVTHFRGTIGTTELFTTTLTTARTIAANGQAAFAIGELDLLFPSGDLGDAGYAAFLALALNGTNVVLVDLMTSSTVVVSASGYAQQDVTNWTRATEVDP